MSVRWRLLNDGLEWQQEYATMTRLVFIFSRWEQYEEELVGLQLWQLISMLLITFYWFLLTGNWYQFGTNPTLRSLSRWFISFLFFLLNFFLLFIVFCSRDEFTYLDSYSCLIIYSLDQARGDYEIPVWNTSEFRFRWKYQSPASNRHMTTRSCFVLAPSEIAIINYSIINRSRVGATYGWLHQKPMEVAAAARNAWLISRNFSASNRC